jgi:hypothetical protein
MHYTSQSKVARYKSVRAGLVQQSKQTTKSTQTLNQHGASKNAGAGGGREGALHVLLFIDNPAG